MGELAKYGRAWVHRNCWTGWELRETWARSAAQRLTQQAEAESVAQGFVVCRLGEQEILLQDTWQAVELSVPRAGLELLLAALASSTPSRVLSRAGNVTFSPGEQGLMVTVSDESEELERFSLEPSTWRAPLERARLTAST